MWSKALSALTFPGGHGVRPGLCVAPGAAAAAPGEEAGLGVLCRVPPASRARIDWLASHAGDWFYYDPIAGVMGVRRLR